MSTSNSDEKMSDHEEKTVYEEFPELPWCNQEIAPSSSASDDKLDCVCSSKDVEDILKRSIQLTEIQKKKEDEQAAFEKRLSKLVFFNKFMRDDHTAFINKEDTIAELGNRKNLSRDIIVSLKNSDIILPTSEKFCGNKLFDYNNFLCLSETKEIKYYGGSTNINYPPENFPFNPPLNDVDLHCMLSKLMNITIFNEDNPNLISKKQEKLLNNLFEKNIHFSTWKIHFFVNLINFGIDLKFGCPSKDLVKIYKYFKEKNVCNAPNKQLSPKRWIMKLANFFTVLPKLVKVSKFTNVELHELLIFILWICLHQNNHENAFVHNINIVLNTCVYDIFDKISDDFDQMEMSTDICKIGYLNLNRLLYSKICRKVLCILPQSTKFEKNLKQLCAYKMICTILGIKEKCLHFVNFPDLMYVLKAFQYFLCYKMHLLLTNDKLLPDSLDNFVDTLISLIDYTAGSEIYVGVNDKRKINIVLYACQLRLKNYKLKAHLDRVKYRFHMEIYDSSSQFYNTVLANSNFQDNDDYNDIFTFTEELVSDFHHMDIINYFQDEIKSSNDKETSEITVNNKV